VIPDSRFPIELSRFGPAQTEDFPGWDGQGDGVPASRDLQIEADGEQYTAIVLIGSRASARLRGELARVDSSLSFAPLHPGTEVNGLTTLGPAREYPVGSFTLVRVVPTIDCGPASACHSGTPLYLVHAPGRLLQPDLLQPCPDPGSCSPPGACYAIGWTSPFFAGGYAEGCKLQLDDQDDQFYCTNMDARWDRVGRMLERPRGARFSDPLQYAFAKVAWDGLVVLITNRLASPPTGPAVRLLWPSWQAAD
jgi:hypothetical protein